MRKYKMSVHQFLELSRSHQIDYLDFADVLVSELQRLNKRYHLLREIADIRKGLVFDPPLFGLPISVKDNICVKGMQACAGSRILEGYIPPFDATTVSRLRQAGGVIIGKTNQDEFGFGTFCTNSAYGIPRNPLDPKRVCGGSSGGAAGLVASLELPHIALAQSTGGSISCPAAWCGVVGLTPTYGLVSRYGLIDYANSLDKIGPIGKCVHDVALLLSIIAGHDPHDSTSMQVSSQDYTKILEPNLKDVRIGIPKEYMKAAEPRVKKQIWNTIHKLESEGAKTISLSLSSTSLALSAYYIIATAEASTNLAKFCGMRYGLHSELKGDFNSYFSAVRSAGFGAEAKRRIMLGTFCRMVGYREAYYLKAMKVRTLVINEFKTALKRCDVIVGPTMPCLPPKFSEIKKLRPSQVYAMDVLTVPPNLAGLPHLTIPVKPSTPIGLHLIGDHLQEQKLLQIGASIESVITK